MDAVNSSTKANSYFSVVQKIHLLFSRSNVGYLSKINYSLQRKQNREAAKAVFLQFDYDVECIERLGIIQ